MTDAKENIDELLGEIARLKSEVERLKHAPRDGESVSNQQNESETRYRNLVELAVDAIFMGDPQGNIIGANQSAVTLTGYSLEELLGRNLGKLFSEEENARVPLRYDLLKDGKVIQSERMLTRKDGGVVPIGMNSRMMPDGTYHTFMRDYTERKENQERLLALIRDLEAFTYTVSHDLRAPLSNILISTEILVSRCEETSDDDALKFLRMIENSAEDMFALVDNLLALARSEEIKRPLELIDVDGVLQKVLATLSLGLEAGGVDVMATPMPSLKVPETFVSQIFQNLVGNALKYGSQPGSSIEVGGERQGDNALLFVRDHGPGIPREEHGQVFDMFYRGRNSGPYSGSGLGLAIVKKIARAFDGRAWVEETPGGGCTFCVEMKNVIP